MSELLDSKQIIVYFVYLIASFFFILGLKKLGSPKTARRGNQFAMIGMLLAIVMTLLNEQILDYTYIIAGLIVGGAIGAVVAKKVQMTSMPEMVALFNGFGGGSSTFVAYSEYMRVSSEATAPANDVTISIVLSVLIGTVTFFGSLIAFAKLQGIMRGAPITFKGQQVVNALGLVAIAVLGYMLTGDYTQEQYLLIIIAISTLLGILAVIPIGGADMPVVISLLNSYSGLAAAATGFVLSNNMLIIAGALVGASGLILTQIMCKAMNRSLANVLFAAVGTDDSTGTSTRGDRSKVTEYTPEDAAMVFEAASSILIVPGYGLAVSQAQHIVHELATMLQDRNIKVRYAIHPVAGRMPGHMNVLLAEANVPYDLLYEMDEINEEFQNTDLALILGANDVVNPAARTDKDSPLYGMPILNVDYAKSVMIVKRSLSPGFAGVDNPLFYADKTMMLFGDAKDMMTAVVKELKDS
ncbi:MAG: NAD(P)(+) transhydrogenase (Re/Si-specific) subunit beta [Calditrichaeota bacterium]|nr:MAG: NAD(P)(+) transhydrogenase (Re/Si-specific) subunit beta [Calditrichota bacterium]